MQIISELEGYRRGPVRRRRAATRCPGEALDTCIAIRTIVLHDGVALLQAGAGIVADSDPAAEHEECLRKLAALETAIELAEASRDDPARRQLRLVHVQPRAPVRRARRGGVGAPERRDRRRRGGAARARRTSSSRPARAGRRTPAPRSRSSDGSRRACRRSASASATRRSSRPSAARSARRSGSSTARRARSTTTAAGSSRACPTRFEAGRYHSLAATRDPGRARGLGDAARTAR